MIESPEMVKHPIATGMRESEVHPDLVEAVNLFYRLCLHFSEDFEDCGDSSLGWGKFASLSEIHTVPGNHYTMFKHPHVKLLPEQLRHCFDRVS